MFKMTGLDGPDGLSALAAELEHAARVAPDEARKVVQKGALNIKKDWRRRWSGMAHLPRLPYAVTYDTTFSGQQAGAEIGPDKDRPQGALGNIPEFGTVNNAPIPGGAPALESERPRFERAMNDLPLIALGDRWR